MTIPTSIDGLALSEWQTFAPHFDELISRELTAQNTRQWLEDWSHLTKLVREAIAVTYIQNTRDTSNEANNAAYMAVIDNVIPNATRADQQLKERLLALNVEDDDMVLVVRKLQNQVDLFAEENIPLDQQVSKLSAEFQKITGGMTTHFDGEDKNLNEMSKYLVDGDRTVRKAARTAVNAMWLAERDDINSIFMQMLPLRHQIAQNAGLPTIANTHFATVSGLSMGQQNVLPFTKQSRQPLCRPLSAFSNASAPTSTSTPSAPTTGCPRAD